MNSYTFYTIHTVVDIGDGSTEAIKNEKFTGTINLSRLVELVMMHSYPMMVSVTRTEVDLSKNSNDMFYDLPASWGECTVSTFKFALPIDVNIFVDGIPLVLPSQINNKRISKFSTLGPERNISISKQTFSRA